MNMLRNIYTKGRGVRNISIKNGKFTITKLKSSRLSKILDEIMPFVIDKSKSKIGASVSIESLENLILVI